VEQFSSLAVVIAGALADVKFLHVSFLASASNRSQRQASSTASRYAVTESHTVCCSWARSRTRSFLLWSTKWHSPQKAITTGAARTAPTFFSYHYITTTSLSQPPKSTHFFLLFPFRTYPKIDPFIDPVVSQLSPASSFCSHRLPHRMYSSS
jgi:hypothetical protein